MAKKIRGGIDMRYIGQDKYTLYLKCRHCNKIYSYDKQKFKKKENSKCPGCGKASRFIWFYPIKIPKIFMVPSLLIMTTLSIVIIFIICFPFFQQFYLFNKAVTALNPLFTSILISALCSFLSLDFTFKGFIKSKEQDSSSDSVKRCELVVIVAECIMLIFAINIIMQTQYCSLEIDNPDTGEIQQYFGNATGEFASGMGRLFNNQGKLVYIGGFKNNLFDGYGRRFELINTVHNAEVSQSYRCVYEGLYKDGLPNGEGREYRYDAEYIFEKSDNVDPNLYYEGAFVEGKYCGYGTLYGLDEKYEGVFFDGSLNGYGKKWFLTSSDKKIYKMEGNFLNGSVNGAAKKYYPDGTILFDGSYENGNAVQGTSYANDGSIRYTGEWDGVDYNGKGILYWQDGQIQFDGSWAENMRSGSGTSFREDGTMEYMGAWEKNQYSGYGKLYYEDGTTLQYAGRYNDGIRSGNGEEYYRDGTLRYSGNWNSGVWNGRGTWFWENGEPYYEGDFVDGQPHGIGTIYSDSGVVIYEGECVEGARNGYGTSYNAGVKEYEGDFLDNKRDGFGTSYWSNGNIQYEGYWQEDNYSGKGKEYDEDGNLLYEEILNNGELISSETDS